MYIYIYIATGTKTVKSIMNPCMSLPKKRKKKKMQYIQILSGIN